MRRLYLDCSHLHRAPAMNTGIERVVRRVAEEALLRTDLEVSLAVLDAQGVFRQLERVPSLTDDPSAPAGDALVFQPGDVYFVLSSSWGMGLLERLAPFRRMGLLVGVLFYDVLPLSHPEVFDAHLVIQPFSAWVDACARHGDFFACISRATSSELLTELAARGRDDLDGVVFPFRLGADATRVSERRERASHPVLASALSGGPTFLTVATIEPRKNHAIVLDAFERLWAEGSTVRWCVVGNPGGASGELVRRLDSHPENGLRLFVCRGVDDADLDVAYRTAKALVYPSIAEGFGLPIAEALLVGMPVLASDIPVFHEVAGRRALYFDPRSPSSIASLLGDVAAGRVEPSHDAGLSEALVATWGESARELLGGIVRIEAVARARASVRLRSERVIERAQRNASPRVNTTGLRGRASAAWRVVRARYRRVLPKLREVRDRLRALATRLEGNGRS